MSTAFNPTDLIDHAHIAAAEANFRQVLTRSLAMPAQIEAANTRVWQAETNYKAAIADGANIGKSRKALADAKEAVTDLLDTQVELERAVAKASANIGVAKQEAGVKLAQYALKTRMELAAEFDRLQAALAEHAERVSATVAMLAQSHNPCPQWFDAGPATAAAEQAQQHGHYSHLLAE